MKRAYQTVAIADEAAGFAIRLDGRPARTPAGRPLLAPSRALAERIAEEWRSQGAMVKPATMPFTQLLNTAIDRMGDASIRAEAVAEISGYAATDLVCFRTPEPPSLAQRQAAAWQPLVEWMADRYGAGLAVTNGLSPPAHAPDSVERVRAAIEQADPPRLAALHLTTGTLGSVVIALALAEGRLDARGAFEAAFLDELHQMEVWGEDAEAMTRLERIRGDIAVAAEFMRLAAA